jgi:poly(A) polymerase
VVSRVNVINLAPLCARSRLGLVRTLARSACGSVFLVGGAVRDALLKREGTDLDFILSEQDLGLAQAFAEGTGGAYVKLDKAGRTVRVVLEGMIYDFSVLQGNDLEADLKQRDFTINGLAVSLTGDEPWDRLPVLDYSGGMADAAAGVIRAISLESLRRDPLRMLRAYRLAAVLGFRLDEVTADAIREFAPLIHTTAAERIVEELEHIFETNRAYSTVVDLDRSHLLEAIFPELRDLKGLSQNGHHHLDVFEHTLETLRFIEVFIDQPSAAFPLQAEVIRPYMEGRTPICLKWSALFHDTGKPGTKVTRQDGRISFPGHAQAGAAIYRKMALRMKLSRSNADRVGRLIALHLRPLLMTEARLRGHLTRKGMARLVKKIGDDLPGLFMLAVADNMAKQGLSGSRERLDELNGLFDQLLAIERKRREGEAMRSRLVTGTDLIAALGLKPGPLVGRILRRVDEAYLAGEVETRDEALFLAQKLLDPREKGKPEKSRR